MVTRPVVAYLDTSDISRFADIRTDHERGSQSERDSIREVYESLQRLVKQGDVEIRFSGLHIAEITKSGSQELATRKAQVIERLCDGLCFRPFEEIWAREVWHLIRSRARNMRFAVPYEVASDHGVWLFKSTDGINLDLDLDVTFDKIMNDSVALNRKGRRALKAQLWRGNRLSDRGLELSRPHWPEAVREIASKFPVNDAGQVVDLFGRFLSGQITKASFEADFAKMLLKPTQMVRFIFEMDELRKHCPRFIIDFGETVVRAVAELRTQLTEVPYSLRRSFSKYVPGALARGPALKVALRSRHHKSGLMISDEEVSELVEHAAFGAFPAIDLISAASKVYVTQHATMPRNPKFSDGPDLLHLTYLPYCDFFRADTYTADVVRQCRSCASATVARSLEELPVLIERQRGVAPPHSSLAGARM